MKRLIVAISLALLSGCVSTESEMPADSAEAPAVNRQRTIDTGYCRQEAEAAAPMPRAVALGAPAGYTVSGTYNRPGDLPTSFRANVAPQESMMDAWNRGSSYADSVNASNQARQVRNDVFAACMAARGW